MTDYLRYAVALAPMGMYWTLIGYLYQRSHPTVLNGAQETLLLGMGAVGWIAIGPMELFFPNAAYAVLGEWTWLFLLALYSFLVLFLALNRRPQWTIYGMASAPLRDLLGRVLSEEKLEHRWLGNVLEVPELGMRAIVEPANLADRSSQLSPAGRSQDHVGWHRLERMLAMRLGSLPSNQGGWAWIYAGVAVLCISLAMILFDITHLMSIVSQWMES
jgi:hypothetical protein